MCVEHLNRCKTSSFVPSGFFLVSNLQGGAEHSGNCTQRSYPLVLEAESDQLCVPAISIFFCDILYSGNGTRLSREPHNRHSISCTFAAICIFDGLFPYLDLHLSTSVQHSELGMDEPWKPLGRAVFYFRTFYMVIPMDTSSRTLLGHYFLWFCMNGIQFPMDHSVDPFQSSVCVCVSKLCVCVWVGGV